MDLQQAIDYCTVSEENENLVLTPPADIHPLDRKVYTKLKKKLESVGLRWNRHKKGFVGPNAETALASIKSAGAQGEDLKKKYQFFETPPAVVDMLMEEVWASGKKFTPLSRVLEPSAGRGAIVRELGNHFGEIWACEIWDLNRDYLRNFGDVNLIEHDFMELHEENEFDLIVANPPFRRNQDIDHIRKMYRHLKPDGLLVALSSMHWTFGKEKKCVEFRDWLKEVQAGTENLDAGLFSSSGTEIATCMIIIRKADEA